MIENENKKYQLIINKEENEHKGRIQGIEELRKKTNKNKIEVPKNRVMKLKNKYGSAYNNHSIVSNFNKL